MPSYSGTISVQEVSYQGIPQLGQGLDIGIDFVQDATPVYAAKSRAIVRGRGRSRLSLNSRHVAGVRFTASQRRD
jgi:hypothetical protein